MMLMLVRISRGSNYTEISQDEQKSTMSLDTAVLSLYLTHTLVLSRALPLYLCVAVSRTCLNS